MARGRQQKWICLDCGAAFAVQGIAPTPSCMEVQHSEEMTSTSYSSKISL